MTTFTPNRPYYSDYELGDYYASPELRDRYRRFWAKHDRRCCACGSRWRIQIHHIRYPKSRRQRGREPDSWLRPLCKICHDRVTALHSDPRFRRGCKPGTAIAKATRIVIWYERRKRFYRWFWRWFL